MTHFLQRSALILLATGSVCAALGASPALAVTHHKAKVEAPPKAANGKIVTLKGERSAYVIKKGDTLEKIADRLDTTVAELMATNKLKKTAVLQPGDVLKGPAVSKKAYVVAHGDTVFSIARRFHVSVEELREENDLSAKTSIKPGQQIRLPSDYRAPEVEAADDQSEKADTDKADARPAKPSRTHKGKLAAETSDESPPAGGGRVETHEAKGETYKAKKGDTLAKIADRLDTDIGELKRLNHVRGSAVHAGQVYHGPSFAEHIYTAAPGDTLASIAARFGVSVASLRAENELSKRVLSVRSGQKIYLPDGYRDRTAPAEERAPRAPMPYQPSRGEPTLPPHPIPYAPSPGTEAPEAATPGPSDAQIQQLAKGRFLWPLTGAILSDYGAKPGGQRNDGINIQAEAGAAVRAVADGKVIYAGDKVPGFGNLVLIQHADGWNTVYAHLSRIDVKNQDNVTQGEQIGQAGATGGVSEAQLHFEVRYQPNATERARSVDPKLVLPKN
ncbi:MAG TPA: LysM peptidoglycan-binding domain-containing protein [Phenylobacterium sp.]|jgi:murein DD-endopeptidase MepM/ murein hydrolase activator NlpD|uniref:LysM peptidoglycan-binding domain-containing protein n=1 Tax=Phenylobacterium sp. TaxID=1871053 RepID=UPI002D6F2B98|nr:LysM peptidoglycan-binding domain-containing protein [Phenylobacterium sp.]HZZ68004.1 LysM peptidoglycan-binding domain-containing protein [Phenylobacterium sp.]